MNIGTLFQLGPDGIGYIRDAQDGKSRGFDLSLLDSPIPIDQFLQAEGRQISYTLTDGRISTIIWSTQGAAAVGA